MIPFEDSVPLDIQECLLPYINTNEGYNSVFPIDSLVMSINWFIDSQSIKRPLSDTEAFQLLYSTANYHTFRRSSVYAKYLATRQPFNPQSIQSMKQSLESL